MAPPRPFSADNASLRQIIAGLPEGVILLSPAGKLLWANPAALRLHGVASQAGLGADADAYHARFTLKYRNHHRLERGQTPIDRLLAGEAFAALVVELTREGADDQPFMHQASGLVLRDEGEAEPQLLVLILQDVSARFDAEARFEQAFNVNPAPAVILRLSDQRYVKVNQGFLDLTGYTRAEVLDASLYDIDVLRDAEALDTAKERMRSGLNIPQMQADLMLPDGGRKLVIVAGQTIELADEPCMLFSFADLEPRRQAENELRHSEERFATAFRLAPVGMAITAGTDFQVYDTNDAFHQLTMLDADHAMGKTMAALHLWEDSGFPGKVAGLLAERSGFRGLDARVRIMDGGVIDCLVSAEAITLRQHACVLWVIQDIHERRHGELELIAAIEAVMQDTNWFSRTVVEKLANLRAPAGNTAPPEVRELTRREKEVLSLLCEGTDDAAIARQMGVSRNTLRNHIARVYGKIGVHRRAQAVLWARERGFPLPRPIR